MNEQIGNIPKMKKKLSKRGERIFELELEIIKLKAELEVEKRYTRCLERVLETKNKGE